MSAIFVLIIISLIVASGFLIAFLWAVGNGQYEDAYGPSVRMLWEESTPPQADQDLASPASVSSSHHNKPQAHV